MLVVAHSHSYVGLILLVTSVFCYGLTPSSYQQCVLLTRELKQGAVGWLCVKCKGSYEIMCNEVDEVEGTSCICQYINFQIQVCAFQCCVHYKNN